MSTNDNSAEGITWISPQSLIQLRTLARQVPLGSGMIHARQGGAYLSSFKGRGMEFDESRIYQAGDDIRNMDWRVTARTGEAHTKVFREERERPVLLWLDLGHSMMFATRNKFKSVIASEIATILAWSAVANNDRIGGLIFSATEHIELKPRRGKTAVLDFIGRCSRHRAWQPHTPADKLPADLTKAVSRLRYVTHPGSLIFMISDFRELDEKARSHVAGIARNNDIVMIRISDPIEASLPARGTYRLTDGISELQIQTSSDRLRQEYHQRHAHRSEQLNSFCRQHRIHLIDISTQDDAIETLKKGLGIRDNSKNAVNRATASR